MALEQELGAPLLLAEAGESLPVGTVDDAAFADSGLAVTSEEGVLSGRRRRPRQDTARQLLLEPGRHHVQQVVHVQPFVLTVREGEFRVPAV
jgi:hypothetical protein